jgi:hypothetical protein
MVTQDQSQKKIPTMEQVAALNEYLEKLSARDFESQQKVKDYTGGELNRIIFYLSTGTFVLSMSFIGYLKTEVVYPYLLIWSWIFFSLAILGQMVGHWVSKQSADRRQVLINESRKSNFKTFYQETTDSDTLVKRYKKIGSISDILIVCFLILGISFLLFFGASNVLNRNNICNQISQQNPFNI